MLDPETPAITAEQVPQKNIAPIATTAMRPAERPLFGAGVGPYPWGAYPCGAGP